MGSKRQKRNKKAAENAAEARGLRDRTPLFSIHLNSMSCMRADVLHDGAQVVPVSVRGGEHGANYVRKSILLGPAFASQALAN